MSGNSSNHTGSATASMIDPGSRDKKSADLIEALDCMRAALSNSAIFRDVGDDEYRGQMLEREAWRAVESGGGVLVVRASDDGAAAVATSSQPIRSAGLFLRDATSAKDELIYIGTTPGYQGYGLAKHIVKDSADRSEAAGHRLVITVKGDHANYACWNEHQNLLKFYHSFGRFSHKSAARSGSNVDEFLSARSGTNPTDVIACECPRQWYAGRQ